LLLLLLLVVVVLSDDLGECLWLAPGGGEGACVLLVEFHEVTDE
jgi:hypothetical protein